MSFLEAAVNAYHLSLQRQGQETRERWLKDFPNFIPDEARGNAVFFEDVEIRLSCFAPGDYTWVVQMTCPKCREVLDESSYCRTLEQIGGQIDRLQLKRSQHQHCCPSPLKDKSQERKEP